MFEPKSSRAHIKNLKGNNTVPTKMIYNNQNINSREDISEVFSSFFKSVYKQDPGIGSLLGITEYM